MESPAISIENMSFSYNGLPVLEKVNLTVEHQGFLCIVGPNAGGKTTLLKLMLGLFKPASGRIRILGQHPARACSRVGYMPQHASLDPQFPASVMDVVLMGRLGGRKHIGPYSRADRQAVEETLEKLRLLPARHLPFSTLSGGQRQRTLMARALVSEPELLLLDEPTANLDAAAEPELYEILNQLNQRITIALVSHDLVFVSRYVKSVACVNRRVVVHPTSEVTEEMINQVYGRDVLMVRHDTIKEGCERCV